MNFLLEFGISESTITILNDICSEEEKDTAILCSDRINSSISYLKSIGVTNETIEELMIDDYTLFMPGEEKLAKAISKVNKELFVEYINSDISYSKYLKNF